MRHCDMMTLTLQEQLNFYEKSANTGALVTFKTLLINIFINFSTSLSQNLKPLHPTILRELSLSSFSN